MSDHTKGDLAEMIRAVKALPNEGSTIESDNLLLSFENDLGFIEILARNFPEDKLLEMEAKKDEPLFKDGRIND